MRKSTKIWLIVAASLTLVGIIMFGGVITAMGFNFRKLSAEKYETNTYEISDHFEHISIQADTENISLGLSDDGECRVVCYEESKLKHKVEVVDGILSIQLEDTRKWYDYISVFSVEYPRITVYLPESEYSSLSIDFDTSDVEIPAEVRFDKIEVSGSTGNVSCLASAQDSMTIKSTTGHISVHDVTVGSMSIRVSTGKVNVSNVVCEGDAALHVSTGKAILSNVTCENFRSDGRTGDLYLNRVIAARAFSIERSTGDVEMDRCDASEIFIKTDTGDVEGTLLSEKVFMVKTDTGDVEVPKTLTGGPCEITTDTGDIEIELIR